MGKFEIGLAGVMGALVLGILASIAASPDSVPFPMSMEKVDDELVEKDNVITDVYELDDYMEVEVGEGIEEFMEKIDFEQYMIEDEEIELEPTVGEETESEGSEETPIISIPKGSGVPACATTAECFVPAKTEIVSGDTVIWSNDDVSAHTVTSGTPAGGPDGIFDSGLFLAGYMFEHTFEDSGTFDYFCLVHPWMEGSIQVE